MAKSEDVIKQMMAVLPKYTDKFCTPFTIQSVTSEGSDVFKIKTTANHGLTTGKYVQIQDVGVVNPITARSASGGKITFTTQYDHDLTEGWHTKVTLKGFTGLADGEYTLDSVPLKNKFVIVSGATITANGNLIEQRIDGINGRFPITVTSLTEFTITAPNSGFTSFSLTADSKTFALPRIGGMTSEDRIVKYYTEQKVNEYWAFVIMQDTTVSYDRNTVDSDAVKRVGRAEDYRAECVQNFNVYVVAPTKDSITGRSTSDEMVAIRAALCKTLCGVQFDSGFAEEKRFGTAFIGDGFFDYVGAYYIHRFTFETVFNMGPADIVGVPDTRAFRRFEVDVKLHFDEYEEVKKTVEGDLP